MKLSKQIKRSWRQPRTTLPTTVDRRLSSCRYQSRDSSYFTKCRAWKMKNLARSMLRMTSVQISVPKSTSSVPSSTLKKHSSRIVATETPKELTWVTSAAPRLERPRSFRSQSMTALSPKSQEPMSQETSKQSCRFSARNSLVMRQEKVPISTWSDLSATRSTPSPRSAFSES